MDRTRLIDLVVQLFSKYKVPEKGIAHAKEVERDLRENTGEQFEVEKIRQLALLLLSAELYWRDSLDGDISLAVNYIPPGYDRGPEFNRLIKFELLKVFVDPSVAATMNSSNFDRYWPIAQVVGSIYEVIIVTFLEGADFGTIPPIAVGLIHPGAAQALVSHMSQS